MIPRHFRGRCSLIIVCLFVFVTIRNNYLAIQASGTGGGHEKIWIKDKVQYQRQQLVSKECSKLPSDPSFATPLVFIKTDIYKLMACFALKVASTTLGKLFLILSGQVSTLNLSGISTELVHGYRHHIPTIEFNDPESINRSVLKDYKRVMFVRHPFERLVSVYYDKFVDPSGLAFQLDRGRDIVRLYRANPSPESLARGHDSTFLEFASYIIDQFEMKVGPDPHWQPLTEVCQPCFIPYDAVVKMETLYDDVELLFRRIGAAEIGRHVWNPLRNKRPVTSTDRVKEAMQQLSSIQRRKLYNIYENDFKIFGYQYDESLY